MKMILLVRQAIKSDLAWFRMEAAAQLDHPNIVPVCEVGEHDGQPFFSMRQIDSVTLAQRLVNGPLPAGEAAAILLSVVRAIAVAHRHGVLHRDLKASNILIDRAGQPSVTDFGLAK